MLRVAIATLAAVVCIVLPGWPSSDGYYPSVHFNEVGEQFDLPPRPFSVYGWGETLQRNASSTFVDDPYSPWSYGIDENERRYRLATLLKHAAQLERTGRYHDAAHIYDRAMKFARKQRSGIQDRIEVLRQVTHETNKMALRIYLRGRDLCDQDRLTEAQGVMQRVLANAKAGHLRAHASYALAGLEYDWGHFRQASALYEKCAGIYRTSPRREPALLMAATSLLRTPSRIVWDWEQFPPPNSDDIRRARQLLWQLLAQYPQTRFKADALGWLGRCEYVQKRYAKAMRFYLKQFVASSTYACRVKSISSMKFVRRLMNAADAKQLASYFRDETDLLEPYLEYRIYHVSRDRRADDPDYSEPDRKQLVNLSDLVHSAISTHPRSKLPRRLMVRLAEIDYRLGRYRSSLHYIERAMRDFRGRGETSHLDLALYLRSRLKDRVRKFVGATDDLQTLLRRFPKSYLTRAARENLAILYEKRGDLGRALEQYFALKYNGDIAFLVDARMTTHELDSFLSGHPYHPDRKLLIYSLGIRYIRRDDLNRASRVFRRLPPRSLEYFAKGKRLPEFVTYIRDHLQDPRMTLRDLIRLKSQVRKAKDSNAQADAMYALASYYYNKRNLLLYNAALWSGNRSWLFGCWNKSHATKRDEDSAQRHHYEHECINRARKICLQIIARYPRAPVAPKALYRAGCCARRLADFNSWWRQENSRLNFWLEAQTLMGKVAVRYPKHPLSVSAKKYIQVFKDEEKMYSIWTGD